MIKSTMSLVYIGEIDPYTRCFMRLSTLKDLGYQVYEKSHQPLNDSKIAKKPAIVVRIFNKLRLHLDVVGVNRWLLNTVSEKTDVKVVWIDKGLNIYPWTLSKLKKINKSVKIISLSEDDMFATHNKSYWFRLGLRHYDHIFTTKDFNVGEFSEICDSKVHLISDSYCKRVHHPYRLTANEKEIYLVKVSAIGAFEYERYRSLLYLAKKGVKVSIWGYGWGHIVGKHCNLDIRDEHLYGDEYGKAISGSRININFLRKVNRDTITSRSVEIPACSGFMLSERTSRQTKLFHEGIEAGYFSSNKELLDKVRYYSIHHEERESIATSGYEKCILKNLSMEDVIQNVLRLSIYDGY